MFALLFDTSKLGGRAGHKFYVIFSGWCNQYKQNKGILMRCVSFSLAFISHLHWSIKVGWTALLSSLIQLLCVESRMFKVITI